MWEFVPSQTQWIWKDGSRYSNQTGYYNGYQSVGRPGARYGFVNWVDPKQKDTLWLFGGNGYGDSGSHLLNDLWRYIEGEGWVWIAGHSTENSGSYQGENKYPGGRERSIGWTDKDGGLWIYGGYGFGYVEYGTLDDLWRFYSNKWTWVSGSVDRDPPPAYTGSRQSPGGIVGPQTWKLLNGNVLLYGGVNNGITNNDIWEWRFDTADWKWLSGSRGQLTDGGRGEKGKTFSKNMLPSRHVGSTAIDSEGSLWLFGGMKSNYLTLYNDLWRYTQDDGWVWITGSDRFNQPNNLRDSSEITPGGRSGQVMWIDNNNNLWLFGGYDGFFLLYSSHP